ncbi:hypothetical protein M2943_11015, partial [Klebsiella pneumoniae]|nr:hypothetical protein [Klebsiella pneumoniae]
IQNKVTAMKFSSRINSFRSRPELFDAKNKMDTCDLITRMGSAEGLTHIELNYPEHFIGCEPDNISYHFVVLISFSHLQEGLCTAG